MSDLNTTCCFTGHRPHKLSGFGDGDQIEARIKERLADAIDKAVRAGYRTFVSGMARGVDTWAAEAVLALKSRGEAVRLVCVLPHHGQCARWDTAEQQRYFDILNKADRVEYICQRYAVGCMEMRNRAMVDMSSVVIAVFDGSRGGTRNTLDYAGKRGRRVVVIRPE